MKTKKELYGTVLIVLGTFLIMLCLLLVLHNQQEDEESQAFSASQLSVLKQAAVQRANEANLDGDSDSKAVETMGESDTDDKMPIVFLEGYGYIGYVTFPTLDLEFPIMDDWDNARLKLAPCRYYGSLQTDDLVVAGHNYRSGFGKIKELNKGDEIYFTDMNGEVYTYRVEEIETLNADEVTRMIASGWDFSLYTCSYDRSRRLTIRCSKIEL